MDLKSSGPLPGPKLIEYEEYGNPLRDDRTERRSCSPRKALCPDPEKRQFASRLAGAADLKLQEAGHA